MTSNYQEQSQTQCSDDLIAHAEAIKEMSQLMPLSTMSGLRGEEMAIQRELTGISMEYPDISGFRRLARKTFGTIDIHDIAATVTDQAVAILGVITSYDEKMTRRGGTMAFLQLSDESGVIKVTVFPKTLALLADVIIKGSLVLARGKVSHRPAFTKSRQQDEESEGPAVQEESRGVTCELILDSVEPVVPVCGSGRSTLGQKE